jgi:hypothetical protein
VASRILYIRATRPHSTLETLLLLLTSFISQESGPQIANMEKGPYNVNEKPGYTGSDEHQAKTGRLAEAADLYGNVEEAEQLGYVTRGCVLLTRV